MATKSGTKTVRDDVAKVLASIQRLTGMDVLVGVPSTKADRDDGEPINNAQLAYIHTYGSTIQVPERKATLYRQVDANGDFKNGGKFVKAKKSNFATSHTIPAHEVVIPPRPFLEPGIKAATPKTTPKLAAAARAALKGDFDGAMRELNKAGLEAQNSVRGVINAGLKPELAESTKRARRARGRTGEKPLEDSGELRNSITYVVRGKK